VSNPVSDEPITCASCEYRYPRSRAICPMCGTAAPAVEPIPLPSPIPSEFRTNHKTLGSTLNSQPRTFERTNCIYMSHCIYQPASLGTD
jgi:hypothetical protein